jgi:hypothetical protein
VQPGEDDGAQGRFLEAKSKNEKHEAHYEDGGKRPTQDFSRCWPQTSPITIIIRQALVLQTGEVKESAENVDRAYRK